MKELFKDIIGMDNVMGLMVFSFKGELLYKDFNMALSKEPDKVEWWPLFIGSMNNIIEADFIFEKSRIYVRKTEIGYLFVVMDTFASIAMLRLNCDILLPALKKAAAGKGRISFFKKKK
jgi:hypothetical protein